MGHLKGFSLHSQKDLNSGCLTVNVFLSLKKKIPTQIYKLNCLTKVYTGHNILASYRLSRKFEVYNQNKKPVRKQNRKKQQIELNKGKKNECHDCFLLAQDHNISGRCCRVRAGVILPVVSPPVTRAKQQITSSFGLSIYTKGIQSNLAMENCLNAHFICFMTNTQYVLNKKKIS